MNFVANVYSELTENHGVSSICHYKVNKIGHKNEARSGYLEIY